MTKPLVSLQDLRRRIYAKAKTEPSWRFWGLFVHVCKEETLHEAFRLAKKNDGAPGIDGVTFEAIEEGGVDGFIGQIRDELGSRKYVPMPNRKKEIPKDGGKKVRVLSIPTIRDRVVQGALLLILEPIFEADFQPGSYGYRPGRTAHEAVDRVELAIRRGKTRVIDVDLRAYFDNVRHHILLAKLAQRIVDRDVMHLLKLILKATGAKGVPQGAVISPLLSNVYLNEVDVFHRPELLRGWQRHPELEAAGTAGAGRSSTVPRSETGLEPLDAARLQSAGGSRRVFVPNAALEEMGHGRDPRVGVQPESREARLLHVEQIEEDERLQGLAEVARAHQPRYGTVAEALGSTNDLPRVPRDRDVCFRVACVGHWRHTANLGLRLASVLTLLAVR